MSLRRVRLILGDILDREIARDREATPIVTPQQLDPHAADDIPVLPLQPPVSQADAHYGVAQALIEGHRLCLETGNVSREAQLCNRQRFGVQVLVDHELTQCARVQLAQCREAHTAAHPAVHQHFSACQDQRAAGPAPPIPDRIPRRPTSRFRRVGAVHADADAQPRAS